MVNKNVDKKEALLMLTLRTLLKICGNDLQQTINFSCNLKQNHHTIPWVLGM